MVYSLIYFKVSITLPKGFKSIYEDKIKQEFLRKKFELIEYFYETPLKEHQIISYLQDADAAVVGGEKITQEVIEKTNHLKIITYFGVGVDKIDLKAAKEKNIYITNVPNANAISVSEFTIGLILSCMRKICFSHNQLRDKNWQLMIGSECGEKILGIIGLGSIGKEVAKRASYLGFNIKAFDINHDYEFAYKYGIKYISLNQLLSISDIITIHVPLNSRTMGMINKTKIKKMKSSSYLINTSRGEIVDEQALIEALELKIIAGVALDVFQNEPPNRKNKFFQFNSLKSITTSHIAAGTIEAANRIAEVTRDNIILVSKGQEPLFITNK